MSTDSLSMKNLFIPSGGGLVSLTRRGAPGLAGRISRTEPVSAENLCHLGRCPTERRRFGQAFGVGRAGLGSAGGGMIFGLWA